MTRFKILEWPSLSVDHCRSLAVHSALVRCQRPRRLFLLSLSPFDHGLFAIQCGRAGPYDPCHRKEAGAFNTPSFRARVLTQRFHLRVALTLNRCKTSCGYTLASSSGVSHHVAMISQASRSAAKRCVPLALPDTYGLCSPSVHHRARLFFFCLPLSFFCQTQCVANCADKFLKFSERVGARFAEHNAGASPSPSIGH